MTPCDLLLGHLDAAVAGTLPEELAQHVEGCTDCQSAVERARGLAEGQRVLAAVRAPESLKQRIKRLPRLAPACEQAIERLGTALDGELPDEGRTEMLDHMRSCPACQAAWEAFATLRDVGANTRSPGRLKAAVALPPRQRLEARRRQSRFFDLRLATAAAYLLAALTVMLLSNPETVARESSYQIDRAATYATAAVQNRFTSYSQQVTETLAGVEGWVRDQAKDVWKKVRSTFRGKRANSGPTESVGSDGGRP
jgi:anti-sigma factor RsiW